MGTDGIPSAMGARMSQLAQEQFIAIQATQNTTQKSQISGLKDGDGDHGIEPNKGVHIDTRG